MITEITCQSIRDLINALTHADFYTNDDRCLRDPNINGPYRWAYRGQERESWSLTPKALRVGQKIGPNYMSNGRADDRSQTWAEVDLINAFAILAARIGLPTPGYDLALSCGLLGANRDLNIIWPNSSLLELTALAQHHGIPTRLLDFTFNPFAALSFATMEVWSNVLSAGSKADDYFATNPRFAIWCIPLHRMPGIGKVLFYEPNRSANPFLKAQDGLFVYLSPENCIAEELNSPIERFAQSDLYPGSNWGVRKITFPTKLILQARNLAHSLLADRSHLMPSYDNVARQALDPISV